MKKNKTHFILAISLLLILGGSFTAYTYFGNDSDITYVELSDTPYPGDKEEGFRDYVESHLADELVNFENISSCDVSLQSEGSDIFSADIILYCNSEINSISKDDIFDYVSDFLGLPSDKISITYK